MSGGGGKSRPPAGFLEVGWLRLTSGKYGEGLVLGVVFNFPEGKEGMMPTRRLKFEAQHYYHIYNRGVNRAAIFFSPDNYEYLLRLCKKNQERYGISIAAYCLLPNHYHFLLKPLRDATVSAFIGVIFDAYVQAINRQQCRCGPLFQGRFRAKAVTGPGYFIGVARYIHANPVFAGLVEIPEAWPYSNYSDIMGLREGTLRNEDLVPVYFPTAMDYGQMVGAYINEKQGERGIVSYVFT